MKRDFELAANMAESVRRWLDEIFSTKEETEESRHNRLVSMATDIRRTPDGGVVYFFWNETEQQKREIIRDFMNSARDYARRREAQEAERQQLIANVIAWERRGRDEPPFYRPRLWDPVRDGRGPFPMDMDDSVPQHYKDLYL